MASCFQHINECLYVVKSQLRSHWAKIDTSTATGKMVFHVLAALAEFERNLTRERTDAGLKSARARGRKGGRPGLPPEKIADIRRLMADPQNTPQWVCKTLQISRSTLYRYLNETQATEGATNA